MSEISHRNEPPNKRRSRPGKCARRRKRKARAILEAADAASASLSSSAGLSPLIDDGVGGDGNINSGRREDSSASPTASATTSTAVPSDRGYTLEGVKVRRREERERRQAVAVAMTDRNAPSSDEAASIARDDTNDDDGSSDAALLDPKDEIELRSQLGFVPGNAVCVAARLSEELLDAIQKSRSSTCNDGVDDGDGPVTATVNRTASESLPQPSPPSVLKLYPMAVRESYRGGKTDGRAFKGRRRGAMRVEDKKDEEDGAVESTTEDIQHKDGGAKLTTKNGKKERAWVVVESSTNNVEQTNGEETTSTNIETNIRQQQRHQPPPQQIIEPFPTLYWLTSPLLRTYISKLEISKEFNVPKMEQRLRSSPSHLSQMERAHESYGSKRWELLTPADRANIEKRGWKGALDERRGVAGIRRRDCVKCLHAHAAHYLAQVAERRGGRAATADDDDENAKRGGEVGGGLEGDDLNLVGKWTMEAVLDLVKNQQQQVVE